MGPKSSQMHTADLQSKRRTPPTRGKHPAYGCVFAVDASRFQPTHLGIHGKSYVHQWKSYACYYDDYDGS